MVTIDRQKVRRSFQQHAVEYEDFACIQKRVIERFCPFAAETAGTPERCLDVGTGTGMLVRGLARCYPQAEIIGVDMAVGMAQTAGEHLRDLPGIRLAAADAEQLPFGDETFDQVVSTSTFQWLDVLHTAFREAYRVLRPGGSFVFALFGEKTLFELRESYRRACFNLGREGAGRTQHFFAVADVVAALESGGFKLCDAFCQWEKEIHDDVPSLLRSVRRIGAGNPAPVVSPGLSERRTMLEMMEIYRREFGSDGRIPATYEVIFGRGIKM